ncbi:MAG: hypothetical protein NT060_02660 [Candidatus Omnitrophica bacterium]|nr:hypothetical protein [Candidatus Omnitrophota bacterium]
MKSFKKMLLITLTFCCTLMLSPFTAMTAQKIALEITYTETDSIGSRLVYQIKEEIRRSIGLRLTNINEPRIVAHIRTLDPSKDDSGKISIFSLALTHTMDDPVKIRGRSFKGEIYISSFMGTCASMFIKEQAERIVANIDKEAEELRR